MNIRSLFYLSLAVFATTAVPGIHASQVQAPLVRLQLGNGENAPTVKFYTKNSVNILEKLLGMDEGRFAQFKEQLGTDPVSNLDYDKHEAIKILHVLSLKIITPEEFAQTEKRLQEKNNNTINPKNVFEGHSWQDLEDELRTLNASFESYRTLYKAMVEVAQDELRFCDEICIEIQAFMHVCKKQFLQQCRERFIQNHQLDCKAIFDFMLKEGFINRTHDFGFTPFLDSIPFNEARNLTYKNTLEAYKIAQDYAKSSYTAKTLQGLLNIRDEELAPAQTQQAAPSENVQTPANSAPAHETSSLQTNNAPAQQQPVVPVTPIQAVPTQAAPVRTQPAVTVQAPVAATVSQPAPTATNPAPAQPSPKLAGTKSFFAKHTWAKYGTYLLAGAAVVYGGYRLYKHVNVNKLVRTARLWA